MTNQHMSISTFETFVNDKGIHPVWIIDARNNRIPYSERLMTLLKRMSTDLQRMSDDRTTYWIPLTQREMAEILSTTSESISRTLAQLVRENSIVCKHTRRGNKYHLPFVPSKEELHSAVEKIFKTHPKRKIEYGFIHQVVLDNFPQPTFAVSEDQIKEALYEQGCCGNIIFDRGIYTKGENL